MLELRKARAPRNRTINLAEGDEAKYSPRIVYPSGPLSQSSIDNRIIEADLFQALELLPTAFVDLLIVDPPYNITKSFNGAMFKERSLDEYETWVASWLYPLLRTLKRTASVYICGDWQSSTAIHRVCAKVLTVRNRITWEREKGRGAKSNWKNCSEDIWFCTASDTYTFNVESVKLRRKVLAPYKNEDGTPKDWRESNQGGYRLTHPSNLWNDITVPFWSMPENTDHPTQKPEKLIAKLVLASSVEGDVILDPFAGSGTSCVVARKLSRRFVGIEMDHSYCCLAEKRLEMADRDNSIQGYSDGVFWERNSLQEQRLSPDCVKTESQMKLMAG